MAKLLEEIHPGEVLLEDFMKPMGTSARQLAADIDVSRRAGSANWSMASAPSRRTPRFGSDCPSALEPWFWLNLQSEYDIRSANRELRAKLAPRIRVFQPAAV